MLGRQVGRAVDGRDVFEDGGLDLRVGQRRGLQFDQDFARRSAGRFAFPGDGATVDGEVPAVELVAVGEHRDQVAAVGHVGQSGYHVCLRALRVDRAVARCAGNRGPQATVRVARVLRTAAGAGCRRSLCGLAGVVDVDQVLVGRDGCALDDWRRVRGLGSSADHSQCHGGRLRRGDTGQRKDREDAGGERNRSNDSDPRRLVHCSHCQPSQCQSTQLPCR